MLSEISCLILSDGRCQNESQALGLAESLRELAPIELLNHHIGTDGTLADSFKIASPKLQFRLKSKPSQYGLSNEYAPDIAIGCGRQAIAPLLALKTQHGPNVFTVYIEDPRLDPALFDMIILPQHDKLRGANIMPIIGAPNRISPAKIAGETLEFKDQITVLPERRIAAFMGGGGQTHRLTKPVHDYHIQLLTGLLGEGYGLMLTSSQHSPNWARADYAKLADNHQAVWYFDAAADDKGANPYFAFLGAAKAILVTQDSPHLLTEACGTGKAVYRLPMQAKSKSVSKFDQFYDQLKERCAVTMFDPALANKALFETHYAPLAETQRAAQQLWAMFSARSAVIN